MAAAKQGSRDTDHLKQGVHTLADGRVLGVGPSKDGFKLIAEYREPFASLFAQPFDPERFIKAIMNMDPEQQKRLDQLHEQLHEKPRQKKLRYTAAKLKRLTLPQVEALLSKAAAEHGYQKLSLNAPQLARHVAVEFTVQDSQAGRGEYDSRAGLKKLIQKALADTNWTLMSDPIDYRLGILQGRLKAVEDEEELVGLVESRQKKARQAQRSSGKSS